MTTKSYEAACKDIENKLSGTNDMDWAEIKDKYNIQCAVDTIRKSSSTIFGGQFREEYFKSKIYMNPDEFSKLKELDKKLEELRKERIKIQTANIERNRLDRSESRQELYYEYIGKVAETLPLPKFKQLLGDEKHNINYLVGLADVHYGAKFKSVNNEYSPEIAKKDLNI